VGHLHAEGDEKCIQNVRKPAGKYHFGDLGTCGRIILEFILRK
jgi:hypothetical protein